MNATLLRFIVCAWLLAFGRDLLRTLMALSGDLEFRPDWAWSLALGDGLWPEWVNFWTILNLPIELLMIVLYWRMIEWKDDERKDNAR